MIVINNDIIKKLSDYLNIKENSIINTLKLLEEGNTIPFIARYRKEATSSLDEEQIRQIDQVYQYEVNLAKRKEDIIRLISEKELMTDEIMSSIKAATKLVELEDIYRPFKEKKKTKATEAIKNGLEPLSKLLMTNISYNSFIIEANKYLNDTVKSLDEAILGCQYIIAENISDNALYRKFCRNYIYMNAMISSKLKKAAVDEGKIYEMYYEYSEAVKNIKPHRFLALNRGEKSKILSISFDYDENFIAGYLETKIIKNNDMQINEILKTSIKDSLKRLILPSVEREIRSELMEKSEDSAIEVFGMNLENLLLTPPLKDKMVLGFDPAFRTGCKLAVVDKTGQKLDIKVIYPHEPKLEYEKSKQTLIELVSKYDIDIIAIGNGTASRESEAFVASIIPSMPKKVEYIIVSEAGASVYSASKLAISEFPDLHVEERSAISIARRIQDPLSELVKIDTKSIGIGQYQHDVSEKKLNESLDFTVTKVVNQVGVNLNTASASILGFISGLNKKAIDNIIEYRNKYGKFIERNSLLKVKGISDKVYTQAIGFLRIIDGKNQLDKTSIHPESYDKTIKLLKYLNLDIKDIGSPILCEKLANINKSEILDMLGLDEYTLEDIIKALQEPLLDPRDKYPQPILKSDILKLEDLRRGMKLQGTVRNVVDFGAFIDIGLKNDGLVHISKMSNKYIKHPSEIVNVGDIVECYVDEVNLEKKKVGLSFKEVEGN